MERLQREALRLIARDRELDRRFRLMLTVPGIGQTSALQILGKFFISASAGAANLTCSVLHSQGSRINACLIPDTPVHRRTAP
jgi:transposase